MCTNVVREFALRAALFVAILAPLLLLLALPLWLLLACLGLLIAWAVFTRVGRQTWSVTQVGLVTIPQRLGSCSVIVIGIAGVVGVLVSLLAMGAGIEVMLKQTGTDDTAIVMRSGAQSEARSMLDRETVAVVSQAPQVLKNTSNEPVTSPERLVVSSLRKKSNGLDGSCTMRGVGVRVSELWPHTRITAGRMFKPGLRELVVGTSAREQFEGLDIGSTVVFGRQSWTVVGIFNSGGAYNSEIWGDTDVVGSAYRSGSNVTSLTVRLADAGAFDAFRAELARDPRVKVDVQTTRQYYNSQSEGLTRMARILGLTVGAIMALGALFGALNTMYAAVATRAREIAILRAIGFRGSTVIVSVLVEPVLLAVLGGVVGAFVAWAIFDGFTASTLGTNISLVAFAFDVSPALLWNGLKWALVIGFAGGLIPAIRASRMPVASGLREI